MSAQNNIGQGQTNKQQDSKVILNTSRITKLWQISNDGITFMAVWESGIYNGKNWQKQMVTDGMILTVYDDGYGLPTVGLGHLVLPKDNIKIGDKITLEQARDFARRDLKKVEDPINERIKVPLFQYEYDALVSILFNAGVYKGKHEKIDRIDLFANILNQGKYEEVPTFIKKFVAGRVSPRRIKEADLFKEGIYDAKH